MKRVRIIAGPNGSGKTTMVNDIIKNGREMGGRDLIDPTRHMNPDDLNLIDILDFDEYGLKIDEKNLRDALLQFHSYKDCNFYVKDIIFINNCFVIPNKSSYLGSALTDYLRDCYVKSADERLFSFETVFSHKSKIKFIEEAKDAGWEVYLYFVSTDDPYINYDRVKERVKQGGHDVPFEKVIDRYTRSLNNLSKAIKLCRRVFIYDNTDELNLIAEKCPDNSLILHSEYIPTWVNEYVLLRLNE